MAGTVGRSIRLALGLHHRASAEPAERAVEEIGALPLNEVAGPRGDEGTDDAGKCDLHAVDEQLWNHGIPRAVEDERRRRIALEEKGQSRRLSTERIGVE